MALNDDLLDQLRSLAYHCELRPLRSLLYLNQFPQHAYADGAEVIDLALKFAIEPLTMRPLNQLLAVLFH